MLSNFVVVSFAAFIGYQAFRMWLPFMPVNAYIAPIWALTISGCFTYLTPERGKSGLLIAVAATGGVAVLNKLTDVAPPEKVSLARMIRRPRTRNITGQSEPRQRIPDL